MALTNSILLPSTYPAVFLVTASRVKLDEHLSAFLRWMKLIS